MTSDGGPAPPSLASPLPPVARRGALGGGEIGAEVHHARLAGAVGASELGDAVAVGEHEPGGAEAARHGLRAVLAASGGVEHVAAVDGDDHGPVDARPADGVAGGHRVVGVDQLERERAREPAQRERQRGRRPRSPGRVGALARRRDVGDIGDRQPVARLRARLAHELGQRARGAARAGRERGPGRDEAVQHEHAHLRAGVARGERLAVGPDPEHRIAAARVELGHDRHPRPPAGRSVHQLRWVVSVRPASRALRYGRSARNERASATASPRA